MKYYGRSWGWKNEQEKSQPQGTQLILNVGAVNVWAEAVKEVNYRVLCWAGGRKSSQGWWHLSWLFFFKILIIYLTENERESTSRRGRRQREREKQAPPWAESSRRGSTPGSWDHDLSKRQTPNWLSHPGAPKPTLKKGIKGHQMFQNLKIEIKLNLLKEWNNFQFLLLTDFSQTHWDTNISQ